MDKHIIGENAGKLWRLLSTDAPRKWTLQKKSRMQQGSMTWKLPAQ